MRKDLVAFKAAHVLEVLPKVTSSHALKAHLAAGDYNHSQHLRMWTELMRTSMVTIASLLHDI